MDGYEINVARDGEHYCCIELPDGLLEVDAIARANNIAMVFGTDYECTMVCWTKTGRFVHFDGEGSTV